MGYVDPLQAIDFFWSYVVVGATALVVGFFLGIIPERRRRATGQALGGVGVPADLLAEDLPNGGVGLAIKSDEGFVSIELSADQKTAAICRLTGLRPELLAFALNMERRLRAHDEKRGWPPMFPFGLSGLLRQVQSAERRLGELAWLGSAASLLDQAADVANMALLVSLWRPAETLSDHARALETLGDLEQGPAS